jgi:hypothetical protein
MARDFVGAALTATRFPPTPTGDWQWMLDACRGEMWGAGALRMVSTIRASLRYWAKHEPKMVTRHRELADALADGDRRFPHDPRRHLAVEIGPEPVEVDPVDQALFDLRAARGNHQATAVAIADALRSGVPEETVRQMVLEVRSG